MKTMKMMDYYRKGQILERGKYSVIVLCTEIATGQQYACKCISKCISQEDLELVQHEIDILWLIDFKKHPNIISIKDVFEDILYIYIVMELCEGRTLYDCALDNDMPLGEPRVAKIIKEIVLAIEACHSLGVVHRDLRFSNLMFQTKDADSPIKVIGFGLAQIFELDEVLTDVVGNDFYTAPEVMKNHHGPEADIWSVGVILHVLLLGLYPFLGKTFGEDDEDIERGYDLFNEDLKLNITESAKDLIQKMLKYDANERLNASEVLNHPWILNNVK